MVGDTPYGVEAARRVGVRMIALRCGGWTDDALAGVVAIYDDPEDLLARYETSPLARPPSPRTNAIQAIPSTIRPHVPPRESPRDEWPYDYADRRPACGAERASRRCSGW